MENSTVRPHVPDEELHAYCDGELSPPQRVEIAEHLLSCLICRAAHAEVEELRARTLALLAIASPPIIHRPAMPVAPNAARFHMPRLAAAAVLAIAGAGGWFALRSAHATGAPGQLATLVAPALLTGSRHVVVTPVNASEVDLLGTGGTPMQPVVPRSDVTDRDPGLVTAWPHDDWDDALTAADGSLARIPGVLVTAVRTDPATAAARPTFMVREELTDGRPVWVFDASAEQFAAVTQALHASGIATSTTSRTRANYQTLDAQGARPARMIVVAGYLSVDSLNVLARTLRLR